MREENQVPNSSVSEPECSTPLIPKAATGHDLEPVLSTSDPQDVQSSVASSFYHHISFSIFHVDVFQELWTMHLCLSPGLTILPAHVSPPDHRNTWTWQAEPTYIFVLSRNHWSQSIPSNATSILFNEVKNLLNRYTVMRTIDILQCAQSIQFN